MNAPSIILLFSVCVGKDLGEVRWLHPWERSKSLQVRNLDHVYSYSMISKYETKQNLHSS